MDNDLDGYYGLDIGVGPLDARPDADEREGALYADLDGTLYVASNGVWYPIGEAKVSGLTTAVGGQVPHAAVGEDRE